MAIAPIAVLAVTAAILLAAAFLQAAAQTQWTFTGVPAGSISLPSAASFKTCRSLGYSTTVYTQTNQNTNISVAPYGFPSTLASSAPKWASSQSTVILPTMPQNLAAEMVYYASQNQWVLFYGQDAAAFVGLNYVRFDASGNALASGTVPVNGGIAPCSLLVDPEYPLLYYVSYGTVGIVNISDPTAPTKLAEATSTYDPLLVNLLTLAPNAMIMLEGTRIMFAPPNNQALLVVDVAQDLATFIATPFIGTFAPHYAVQPGFYDIQTTFMIYTVSATTDALGKYAALVGGDGTTGTFLFRPSSPYPFLGKSSDATVSRTPSLLGDTLVTFNSSNGIVVYNIVNDTTSGSATFPRVRLVQQAVNMVSAGALNFSSGNFSLSWRDGTVLVAGSNTAMAFGVQAPAGVNLSSLVGQLPANAICNKTTGIAALPPLQFIATQPLVVDAFGQLAVNNQMLFVTDGKRNFRWNQIRYTITAVSIAGSGFQVYSNTTRLWNTVSSFLQTDVNDQLVRFQPANSFMAQCLGGVGPAAQTGAIQFTVSDVWGRSLGVQTVPVAIVCCAFISSTINSAATVSAIAATSTNVSPLCTRILPGYYTDTSGAALPCPLGTFNPNFGGGKQRDVCLSCPDGATTAQTGSTAWSQCICPYCYLNAAWSLPTFDTDFYFRPVRWVSAPHADRPLLFTFSARARTDATVGLYASASISTFTNNGTQSSAPFYVVVLGGLINQFSTIRNPEGGAYAVTVPSHPVAYQVFTQVWVFYWKGLVAAGPVPFDVDLSTSTFARDELIPYLMSGNFSFANPTAWYSGNLTASFTDERVPVVDVGFLSKSVGTPGSYSNAWNIQVDDMIDTCSVTCNYPMPYSLASTMSNSAAAQLPIQMQLTGLPLDLFTVTWSMLGASVNCTWINSSLNVFDFTPSAPFLGSAVVLVVSDGTSSANQWSNRTWFTQPELSAGIVALRVLQPRAAFAQASFSLNFTVTNTMIRVKPAFTTFPTLTFTFPSAMSNGALELSSWRLITGTVAASLDPLYGTRGVPSTTVVPGSRTGAAVALAQQSVYVFGGSTSMQNFLGDLWAYDLGSNQWTWVTGSSSGQPAGVYGTAGVAGPSNTPPGRIFAAMTYDSGRGGLWLFGGRVGYTNSNANDLWFFNQTSGLWTWFYGGTTTVATGFSAPYTRWAAGGLAVDQLGRVLVYGNDGTSALWCYTLSTAQWSLLNAADAAQTSDSVLVGQTGRLGARWEQTILVSASNELFVLFGKNATTGGSAATTHTNSIWRWDLATSSATQWVRYAAAQSLPGSMPFRIETSIPPVPRGYASAVADSFGNVYTLGGTVDTAASCANDLLVYNTIARTWTRLAGTDPRTVSTGNPGSVQAARYIPSLLNQAPSSCDGNSLQIQSSSSNSRYYTLYMTSMGNSYAGLVFMAFDVYVPPSIPAAQQLPTLSVNVWLAGGVIVNTSFVSLLDYDSIPPSLNITPTSAVAGKFRNLSSNQLITSFAYSDVLNGSRIQFEPSNNSFASTLHIPITIRDADGNTNTSSINVTVSCSGVNASLVTCTCPVGYLLSGSSCSPCPLASYKPVNGNAVSCTACPSGTVSSGRLGQTNAAGACNCSAGSYNTASDGISVVCAACPAGSSGTGLTGQSTAYAACRCNAGFYNTASDGISVVCTACPINSSATGLTGQSTAYGACRCNAGYFNQASDGVSVTCASCPANTVANGAVGQSSARQACNCSSGYYNSATDGIGLVCTGCPSNSAGNGLTGQTTPRGACWCDQAFYNNASDNSSVTCAACPVNSITSGRVGQSSVYTACNCSSGYYNTATDNSSVTCTACPAYSGATNLTGQTTASGACQCNSGYFNTAVDGVSVTCAACPANAIGNGLMGQMNASLACNCSSGYFNSATNGSPLTCSACPANSIATGAVGQLDPHSACKCSSGFYDVATDGISLSCNACPANSIGNGATGQISPHAACNCSAGFYDVATDGVSLACTACPALSGPSGLVGQTTMRGACNCSAGYYNNATGGVSLACIGCPADSVATGLTGQVTVGGACKCAAGFYNNATGPSNQTCVACPTNATSNGQSGQRTVLDACQCQLGYYNGAMDNVSLSCFACPSNAVASGARNQSSVAGYCQCASGYYNTAADNSTLECTACPSNSSPTGLGVQNATTSSVACSCNAGFFIVEPGNVVLACSACPQDTYGSSPNATADQCAACRLGTYTQGRTGQSSSSQCVLMAEWVAYNATYNVCAAGYGYNSSQNSCTACAVGSYKSDAGRTECTSCGAGQSTAGAEGSTNASACVSSSALSSAPSSAVPMGLIVGCAVGAIVALIVGVGAVIVVKQTRRRRHKASRISRQPTELGMVTQTSHMALRDINQGSRGDLTTPKPYVAAQHAMRGRRFQELSAAAQLGSNNSITIRPANASRTLVRNNNTNTAAPSGITQFGNTTYSTADSVPAFPGFLLISSDDGYLTKRQIAKGGFCQLYEGELLDLSLLPPSMHNTDAKRVAIKVFVAPSDAVRENQEFDLENEAAVLYSLRALPNVVKLLAVSRTPDLALVMKLYEESLHRMVHSDESTVRSDIIAACDNSWINVSSIMAFDLLTGLNGMHKLSICHLDIKPQNMLIERLPQRSIERRESECGFRLVIADLGLARFMRSTLFDSRVDRKLTAGLSMRYAAPEAHNIVRLLDQRVPVMHSSFIQMDVYSTAITLWQTLTREAPFPNLTMATAEQDLLNGLRPPMTNLPVPRTDRERARLNALSQVITQSWNTNPDCRPSVEDLLDVLSL